MPPMPSMPPVKATFPGDVGADLAASPKQSSPRSACMARRTKPPGPGAERGEKRQEGARASWTLDVLPAPPQHVAKQLKGTASHSHSHTARARTPNSTAQRPRPRLSASERASAAAASTITTHDEDPVTGGRADAVPSPTPSPALNPAAAPKKKPRSGSLSGLGGFTGSFSNLADFASGKKMLANMHSPQLVAATSGRRGSIALTTASSAEDSCLYVDAMIRGIQRQLREELDFRELVIATGEEAEDDDGLATLASSSTDRLGSSGSGSGSMSNVAATDASPSTSPAERSSNGEEAWESISKRVYMAGERSVSDASNCSECQRGTVYVSRGYESKARLLVIVPYREAGIWSRSICMAQTSESDDRGSMLSYLKKALAENYGVVIFNPAAQPCHPRAHVEHAWDALVAPLDSEVFIVAFSRGAQLVQHLLNYDAGQGVMQDRVKALALVEPSHYVSEDDSYFARRMLARRAVAWILSSEIDVGSKIPRGQARHGCVCISAGSVPSDVAGSSGAYALEMVMSSVFGSFAARGGEAAGITVNAAKISACGICHRKLGVLNRRIPCSWCQVKYCSRCCEDKFVPAFGSWRVCSLCQSLPCLIDPRRKNRSATNHQSPTNAQSQERCSVFIRPTADDDDPVCLNDFEIVKLVGRGACGRVKLVRKKHGYDEGVFYAMKAIRKKLVIQRGLVEATNAERRILDRIKHPYVATLHYAFQTDAKLYLLSKYYPGGNLLDQMRLARRFSEDRTRLYAAEVALAIRHLHQNDIIYRDLKLENVLVDSDGHVALTDFGMSKENMPDEGRTTTFVGTYQMMAPEVFGGKSYSRAVDWWALGVMVYEMIDGRTPFNAKTNRLIKERIVNVDLKFSPRFTESAKDFVSKLLTKSEEDRLGCGEHGFEHIKNHPWFQGMDWERVALKEVRWDGQLELMAKHAKEYRTQDIFDTYMNTVEVPVDTPASVKSSNDELFGDFAFNYMDGPDDTEERDVPEPDEEGDEDPVGPLSPLSGDDEAGTTAEKSSREPKEGDELLKSFLSTTGSHFDISLLRPDQATDFGVSACSSLSSEGSTTSDEAVPVDQLENDALGVERQEEREVKTEEGKEVPTIEEVVEEEVVDADPKEGLKEEPKGVSASA